jgi:type 1 glutamine amidotransferase
MRPLIRRSLLLCALSVAAISLRAASASSLARITTSFPTAAEIRTPDISLPKTERHGADLLAFSPSGRLLISTGMGKSARLWETKTGEDETGKLLHTWTINSPLVDTLAFSADGKTAMALGDDQEISVWDPEAVKVLSTSKTKATPRNAVFRPGNEPQLAESTAEGARLTNWRTGDTIRDFISDKETTRALTFTPDGKLLIGVTRGGNIWIWETDTAKVVRSFPTRTPVIALLASATDIATASARGGVQLWPITGGEGKIFAGTWPMALSPRGDQIAACVENAIHVWDVKTGEVLCSQEGHPIEVMAVAFSPNGQKMASSDREGTINLWTVPLPPLPPAEIDKIKNAAPGAARVPAAKPHQVLVFWRADAILHKDGVPAANYALQAMAQKTGAFTVHFSRDYAALDPKVLSAYDAIVLNSTAHLAIPDSAKKALINYVKNGGGVVGIHAAIDTFKAWPEGASIVGATFAGHPWGPAGTWAVKLDEPEHPLARAWAGKNFKIQDEIYEMGDPFTRADRRVLLSLDLTDAATANPGAEPLHRADRDFAVAWIKSFGQGRVFYCSFGHRFEPFENPAVQQFYLDGLQYVLGDLKLNPADEAPKR